MLLRKLPIINGNGYGKIFFKTLAGDPDFEFLNHGPLGDYIMADKAYGNL